MNRSDAVGDFLFSVATRVDFNLAVLNGTTAPLLADPQFYNRTNSMLTAAVYNSTTLSTLASATSALAQNLNSRMLVVEPLLTATSLRCGTDSELLTCKVAPPPPHVVSVNQQSLPADGPVTSQNVILEVTRSSCARFPVGVL